jgi:hypothetical protein
MRAREVKVGGMYAFPTNPGPWYRYAVPARAMAHGPRARVLVLLPDGVPETPVREQLPRSSLVWIDVGSLVCTWEEWPAQAATTREDMTAVVASAVAAIGGRGAPTLDGPTDVRESIRWWSRPIGQLLRPPALTPSGRSHAHDL